MAEKRGKNETKKDGPHSGPYSFEEALKELEKITEQIERGEIGLEESIAKYEEGMKLVAKCRTILTRAEQRIQTLAPTPSGDLKTVDTKEPSETS